MLQDQTIPRIVHLSWIDESIFEHESPIAKHGVQSLISLNPEWKVTLHTESQVNDYLKEELGNHVFRLLENTHIVERLDVWRLIKLFNEGGMYVDIDRLHNLQLDLLLPEQVRCVLPMSGDMDFSQDLMISAPGNPLYLKTLDLSLQRRREGATSIYFLGPQTYMHAVSHSLLGRMVDTNPSLEDVVEMRKAILSSGFISGYRETLPYDTFTFRLYGDEKPSFDHELEKRKFYASYGLKHWTNDW
jgi:mannosyltransferase OCH1-like enzyme